MYAVEYSIWLHNGILKKLTKTNLNSCYILFLCYFYLSSDAPYVFICIFKPGITSQRSEPWNHVCLFFILCVSLSPLSHSGTLNICLSFSSETMDNFVVLKQSLFYLPCVMESYNKCVLVLIYFPFSVSFDCFSF